jgi:superfamily II DNA or RNA helicase
MANTKVIVKKYIEFCNKNNIRIQTYQIYGVLWCIRKERELEIQNKCSGGILADDMGMGKTIQMIMTIFLNFKKKTLIILPPILIQQWYSEILRIIGHTAFIYYKKNKNINSVHKSNIVITSYDTLLRSPKLFSISWDRVICDEAHRLRNHNTKIYKKISILHTNILWCITGTPIHNSSKDLVSLFSLCNIEKPNWKNHFLQRFRKDMQSLDPIHKTESAYLVEWKNEKERNIAKDIHSSISCLGFPEQEQESFWEKTKTCSIVSMIRASQSCIFSKMIEIPIKKKDPEDIPSEYLEVFDHSISTKIQTVISHILERKNNGNGKILFCHYRLEIKRITEILENNGVEWVGNWKAYQKIEKEKIQTPILIMQIRSGCEGLNLQAAFSEVYFISPNWNPALESQAIGRCFRNGQQKKVEVFRFYMNSVDSPVNNAVYKEEIRKYNSMIYKLPFDITRYICEFLDPLEISKNYKYSLDKYIHMRQEKKKEKIEEFLRELR